MEHNISEIEIVTTVEITHIYSGKELDELASEGLLPDSPEDLENFKSSMAEEIKSSISGFLEADHVGVTAVQYFEKEKPEGTDAD